MTAPRLEVHLDRVEHNARVLVERLHAAGIAVTGVTKATLGSPEIARALLAGGVRRLGDARIENIERLRAAGIAAPITLIRSPMASQVDRVVRAADRSCNTELGVLRELSRAAVVAGCSHGVVLMVELGDLREGILPGDVAEVVGEVVNLPGLVLHGLGTNLACQSGVVPDAENMGALSALAADSIERQFDLTLEVVTGGNSANLDWALSGADVGRIDDLRLGEAILLGREPLRRTPIDGLRTDVFSLVAEVIEAKVKPTRPWGGIEQTAFGSVAPAVDRGEARRAIVALGRQDIDPDGLAAPAGIEILGASSDHLVLNTGDTVVGVGAEVRFALDYAALLRAMTSPFVTCTFVT